MINQDIKWILEYAKQGINAALKDLSEFEKVEVVQRYKDIEKVLLSQGVGTTIIPVGIPDVNKKEEANKFIAPVKKWFSGIGDRARLYQKKDINIDAFKDGLK